MTGCVLHELHATNAPSDATAQECLLPKTCQCHRRRYSGGIAVYAQIIAKIHPTTVHPSRVTVAKIAPDWWWPRALATSHGRKYSARTNTVSPVENGAESSTIPPVQRVAPAAPPHFSILSRGVSSLQAASPLSCVAPDLKTTGNRFQQVSA